MMGSLKLKYLLGCLLFMALLAGCGEDDFPVPQASSVVADFSFTVDGEGFAPSTVQMINETFLTSEASNVTYVWNFGDGSISNEESPSHVYSAPGTYVINLAVSSADDVDFAQASITIRDPNALEARLFFIDAGTQTINEVDGASFDAGGFGTGIAYDATNDKIYYTNADDLTLERSNLDGSESETIVGGFSDPRDLALDIANNRVYVADRGSDVQGIWEVDLSSNSATILYDNASDGLGELPVGIDIHNGDLFITCVEIDAESVWVGNVDGSGVNRIIDYNAGGYGYGIAVDAANEKIYFDNTDSGEILSADLDGQNIQSIIATGDRVYGITIDNTNGKMYWTERGSGSVFMANLDGSSPVTITSDFDDPRGLFFID